MKTVTLEDRNGDCFYSDEEEPIPRRLLWGKTLYERFEGTHFKEVPFRELFETRTTFRISDYR